MSIEVVREIPEEGKPQPKKLTVGNFSLAYWGKKDDGKPEFSFQKSWFSKKSKEWVNPLVPFFLNELDNWVTFCEKVPDFIKEIIEQEGDFTKEGSN